LDKRDDDEMIVTAQKRTFSIYKRFVDNNKPR
jgi:hypothetical protein